MLCTETEKKRYTEQRTTTQGKLWLGLLAGAREVENGDEPWAVVVCRGREERTRSRVVVCVPNRHTKKKHTTRAPLSHANRPRGKWDMTSRSQAVDAGLSVSLSDPL